MNSAQEFLLKVGIHDKVIGNAKRTEDGKIIVGDTSLTYLSDMMEFWAKRKIQKLESEKAELISGINEIIYTYKRTISPSKLLFSIRNLETIIEKHNPQS